MLSICPCSVICNSPPMLQSSVLGEIAVMKQWRGSTPFNRLPNPSALIFFEIKFMRNYWQLVSLSEFITNPTPRKQRILKRICKIDYFFGNEDIEYQYILIFHLDQEL